MLRKNEFCSKYKTIFRFFRYLIEYILYPIAHFYFYDQYFSAEGVEWKKFRQFRISITIDASKTFILKYQNFSLLNLI